MSKKLLDCEGTLTSLHKEQEYWAAKRELDKAELSYKRARTPRTKALRWDDVERAASIVSVLLASKMDDAQEVFRALLAQRSMDPEKERRRR